MKRKESCRAVDDLRGLNTQEIKELKKHFKKKMKHFETKYKNK